MILKWDEVLIADGFSVALAHVACIAYDAGQQNSETNSGFNKKAKWLMAQLMKLFLCLFSCSHG